MAWFRKKPDPISDRARVLNREIAALQTRIKTLDSQLRRHETHPQGATVGHSAVEAAVHPAPEPIFEDVVQDILKAHSEAATPDHYNDLGVRKYDLPGLVRRIRTHFRGPSASNPKLVSYLAAGGIQGLRPLRYEKRVARNRFIFFVVCLILVLVGLVVVFLRR
jgi:hypothetical protein